MLLVLETLAPLERAVFVLREVFDVGYDEIAAAVDRTPASVRQIAHRAREHVAARRPRAAVDPSDVKDALEAFRRAMTTGDVQTLLEVLAPDVTLIADGGGVRQAALRPILGADKVMRFLVGALGKAGGTVSTDVATVNGAPALVIGLDGEVDGVLAARMEAGRITGLYYVRNPEKLARLSAETPLALR
jgi:RNA polymerase sigma-70 factor (ECF subfamily)